MCKKRCKKERTKKGCSQDKADIQDERNEVKVTARRVAVGPSSSVAQVEIVDLRFFSFMWDADGWGRCSFIARHRVGSWLQSWPVPPML